MRKIMTFGLFGLLLLSFIFGYAAQTFASDPRARTISVFRVDGEEASLLRNNRVGRAIIPRDGQRLSSGNVIATGYDTRVNFALDADSIVRMGESSRVQVGAVGTFRRRLSLTVSLGSVLVNVQERDVGLLTDIVVGNTAFSIRGTMFIMSRTYEGHALIIMLSGEGVVEMPGEEPVYLRAGQAMVVYDRLGLEDEGFDYVIYDLVIANMPLFALEEIEENSEYLLGIGTVTEDMLMEAANLIPILRAYREQERVDWYNYVAAILDYNPRDVVLFLFEEFDIDDFVFHVDGEYDFVDAIDEGYVEEPAPLWDDNYGQVPPTPFMGNNYGLPPLPAEELVTVPNVVGMYLANAFYLLDDVLLNMSWSWGPATGVTETTVLTQSPVAGTLVARNSTVSLTIASAPEPTPAADLVTVPNIVGMFWEDAYNWLTSIGLAAYWHWWTSSAAEDTVLWQSPVAGTQVESHSVVSFSIAAPLPPGPVMGGNYGQY